MGLPALTHHEIIGLVEPFARQGLHVDLAASDRAERRIHFRAREVAALGPCGESLAWRETLVLDCRSEARFTLTRSLTPAEGPAATLLASGAEPAELLVRIQAVPPERQFSSGKGYRVACSYDTALPSGAKAARGSSTPTLVLTRAVLQVQGLSLSLQIRLPGLRTVAADLTLHPAPGAARPALPEDLLAVIGWDWTRLVPDKTGWTSKLRLRGAVLRRSRTAERALEIAGQHLAQVLAEPPAQFHERHALRRWGVVLRRAIPSLTAIFMVLGALLLPRLTDPNNSGMWMALHYVPIALLAVAFSLQELAQFEIPPWPRKLRAANWLDPELTSPDPTVRA